MHRVMSHHLTFGGSYHSLVFNANNVVNRTPNAAIKIPATKYKIDKFMKPIFESQIQIKCKQCSNYISSLKSKTQCELCQIIIKTRDSDYFHYIPIKQQIVHMLRNNIDDILAYYSTATKKHSTISDIHNGVAFKNAQKMYPNYIILPLIVNTDGVKTYKSTSSSSLWLIQIYQGYIPPCQRYLMKNILIIAAHFGKTISMSDFFYPLLNEMRSIVDNGGITIMHNKQQYTFMPLLLGACCDIPATEHLRGTAGYAGHFACGYCVHPGVSIKRDENSKPYVRYVKGSYENRTHGDFIAAYDQLKFNADSLCGIKRVSCMIAAHSFNLSHGFAIDHMHCAELGIMKKLLSFWLDTNNHKQPYYIKKKDQVILSNRILSLKPTSEISRAPRSIFSKGEYKANELRNMLLFFLRFSLPGLLGSKYIKHFHLFSAAMYTLLQKDIPFESIKDTQRKLNEFADTFEELYGKHNVTINLHLLRHLPETVQHLGPLWAQSSYGFESNNGVVVRWNTSTKDMTFQLVWKYIMKHSIEVVDENVREISLGRKKTLKLNSTESQLFTKKGFELERFEYLTIYTDFVLRGVHFKSLKSNKTARIDHFVELKNGTIASVLYYTIFDLILYAVIENYEIVQTHDHFIEINETFVKNIIKASEISKKLIFLKYGLREFVTDFPNKFEKT